MKIKKTRIIIIKSFFNSILILCSLFLILSFGPFLQYEIEYRIFNLTGKEYKIDENNGKDVTLLQAIFSSDKSIYIKPKDINFDIIIPQIGLNEAIKDVDSNNDDNVTNVLKNYVGRANGTAYPNEYGNMYLFAHSSSSVLSIDRYNAVFTLIRDLNYGDKIYIYYKGVQYTYEIYSKNIVSPNNTNDITFQSPYPEITLQTCDPPGTNFNRLLIKAKRI